MSKIDVMVFEPGVEEGRIETIEHSLDSFYRVIDCRCIDIRNLGGNIALVCDDEYLIRDDVEIQFNRLVGGYPFYGTFFLARVAGEDLASLTDYQVELIRNRGLNPL